MLLKENKLDSKNIEQIFKEKNFLNSKNLTLKFLIKKNSKVKKMAFVVGKNLIKSAVKRNFLKRTGFLVLKDFLEQFPNGFLGVFILNKNIKIDNLKDKNNLLTFREDLKREILFFLNKINRNE